MPRCSAEAGSATSATLALVGGGTGALPRVGLRARAGFAVFAAFPPLAGFAASGRRPRPPFLEGVPSGSTSGCGSSTGSTSTIGRSSTGSAIHRIDAGRPGHRVDRRVDHGRSAAASSTSGQTPRRPRRARTRAPVRRDADPGTRARRPVDRARFAARLPWPAARSKSTTDANPYLRSSNPSIAPRRYCFACRTYIGQRGGVAACANACCTARMPSCMLIGDGGSDSSSSTVHVLCVRIRRSAAPVPLPRVVRRVRPERRRPRHLRAIRRACCGPRASA